MGRREEWLVSATLMAAQRETSLVINQCLAAAKPAAIARPMDGQ